jgi:Tol biopolymer transport system component
MLGKFLLLIFLCSFLNIYSQINESNSQNDNNYKLINTVAITPPGGYSSPKWSPDGKRILFTKMNYVGLYVVDVESKEITTINKIKGAGFDAIWSEDCKSIYYRHKIYVNDNKKYKPLIGVKSIDIATKLITNHPEIDINGISSSVHGKSNNDLIIYLDKKTLMVKARTMDNSKKWDITKDERNYFISLSPDKTKVLVGNHDKMFVYASDGSGLINTLGGGIGGSWSKDSKQILFHISEDDGHRTTGSELYLINSDGSNKWQLTITPNFIEEYPDWSPDNKKIAFSDINTGVIYMADLIKN